MALVAGFEFDIFISYSHVDNLPVEGERWVERFHDRLQVELYRKEGSSDIKIWRDCELEGNQKFDQVLRSRLEKSVILLCLNSPGYAKSSYCAGERDHFVAAQRDQVQTGDRSRFFNVLLYNIPFKQWPDAFQGDAGFPFYSAERPEYQGNPLDVKSGAFSEQLHRLADALLATLHQMRDRQKTPPEVTPEAPRPVPAAAQYLARPSLQSPSQPATEKRARLFFSKVSDTLAARKKRVIAELTREGYEVLDAVPPPFESRAHDEALAERLKEADLAIHLLDQFPGELIPGEEKGYIQRQAEFGRGSGTPQLIWVPKDLALAGDAEDAEPEEKAYRAFIGELAGGSRGKANYEFVQGAPSEIAHEIRDRMERRKAAAPVKATAHPAVLLDYHPKDEPYFYDVYQFLDQHGIQPRLNRAVDDPRGNAGRFEEQLERVNGMIVIFGSVARDWVLERVWAAARSVALRRYPIRAFGIYLAPPHKEEGGLPDDWRPLNVYPIDNTDGFNENSFGPLIAELNKAGLGNGRG
jgi:hypothetical protein